jgi:hypothetical protein
MVDAFKPFHLTPIKGRRPSSIVYNILHDPPNGLGKIKD